MIAFALADHGDAILINRPIYGRFEIDFKNRSGVEVVYADTEASEICKVGVVRRYEEAIEREAERGVRVRALLIVNPHNPLGGCSSDFTESWRSAHRYNVSTYSV